MIGFRPESRDESPTVPRWERRRGAWLSSVQEEIRNDAAVPGSPHGRCAANRSGSTKRRKLKASRAARSKLY